MSSHPTPSSKPPPTSIQSGQDHYSNLPRPKRHPINPDGAHTNGYITTECQPPIPRHYPAPSSKLHQHRNPLRGHWDCVHNASFSDSGAYLVTSSRDKTVKIWACTEREQEPLHCVDTLSHPQRVFQSFRNDNANRVVTTCADGAIRVWTRRKNPEENDLFVMHKKDYRHARGCQISADGQLVVASFYTGLRTPISRSNSKFISSFRSSVVLRDITTRKVLFDISIPGKVDQCRLSSCASVIALGSSGVNPAEGMANGCSISIVDRAGNFSHVFHDILRSESICTKWDLSSHGDRLVMVSPDRGAILVYERDAETGWRDTPIVLSACGPYTYCSFAEKGKYVMAIVGLTYEKLKSMRIFSMRKRNVLYEIPCILERSLPLSVEPSMRFTYDSYGKYEQVRIICKDMDDANSETVDLVTSRYTVESYTNTSKPPGDEDHKDKKRTSNYTSRNDDSQHSEVCQIKSTSYSPGNPGYSSKWRPQPSQTNIQIPDELGRPQSRSNGFTRDRYRSIDPYGLESSNQLLVGHQGECGDGLSTNSSRMDPGASHWGRKDGSLDAQPRSRFGNAGIIGIPNFSTEKTMNPDHAFKPNHGRADIETRPNNSVATSSYHDTDEANSKSLISLSRDPRIRAKSILKKNSQTNYYAAVPALEDPSPFAIVGNASSLKTSGNGSPQHFQEPAISPPWKRQRLLSVLPESQPLEKGQSKDAEQRSSEKTDKLNNVVSKTTREVSGNDVAANAASSSKSDQVPNYVSNPVPDQLPEPASEEGPNSQCESLEEGELPCSPPYKSFCPENSSTPEKSNLSTTGKEQMVIRNQQSYQEQVQEQAQGKKAGLFHNDTKSAVAATKVTSNSTFGGSSSGSPSADAHNNLDHESSRVQESEKPGPNIDLKQQGVVFSVKDLSGTVSGRCSAGNAGSNSAINQDRTDSGASSERSFTDVNNRGHVGSNEQGCQKPGPNRNGKKLEIVPSMKKVPGTFKRHPSAGKTESNSIPNENCALPALNVDEVIASPDLLVHIPLPTGNGSDSRDYSLARDSSSDEHIPIAWLSRRRASRRTRANGVGKTLSLSQRRSRKSRRRAGSANHIVPMETPILPEKNAQSGDGSQNHSRIESTVMKPKSLNNVQVNSAPIPTKVQETALQKAIVASDGTPHDSSAIIPSGRAVGSDTGEVNHGYTEAEPSGKIAANCPTKNNNQDANSDKTPPSGIAGLAEDKKDATLSQAANNTDVDVKTERTANCPRQDDSIESRKVQLPALKVPAKLVGSLLGAGPGGTANVADAKAARIPKGEDVLSMLQRKARLAFDKAADRVSTSGQQYITGVQAFNTIREMLKPSLALFNEKDVARIVYGKTGAENICTEPLFVQAFCELCCEAQTRRRPRLESIFTEALPAGEKTLLAFHAGDLLKRALGLNSESQFAHWSDPDLVDVFVSEGRGMLINVEAFVVGAEKAICGTLGLNVDSKEVGVST